MQYITLGLAALFPSYFGRKAYHIQTADLAQEYLNLDSWHRDQYLNRLLDTHQFVKIAAIADGLAERGFSYEYNLVRLRLEAYQFAYE